MWIRFIDYLLAGAGLAGHILLLVLLFRRHLFSRFGPFAVLVVFYALRTIGFFFLSPATPEVGWSLAALDPLLQCGVFVSIVVAPAWSAAQTRTLPAFGVLAAALAIAAAAAWYMGPSSHYSNRNLLLKSGIFISMLWLQSALAAIVPFRRFYPAEFAGVYRQIVFGFALYSAASLLAGVGHDRLQAAGGMAWYLTLAYLPVSAYLLCLWIWISALRCATSAGSETSSAAPQPAV